MELFKRPTKTEYVISVVSQDTTYFLNWFFNGNEARFNFLIQPHSKIPVVEDFDSFQDAVFFDARNKKELLSLLNSYDVNFSDLKVQVLKGDQVSIKEFDLFRISDYY